MKRVRVRRAHHERAPDVPPDEPVFPPPLPSRTKLRDRVRPDMGQPLVGKPQGT